MFLISPCILVYKKLRSMIFQDRVRIQELEKKVSDLKEADELSEKEIQEAKIRLEEIERTVRAAQAQVLVYTGPYSGPYGKGAENDGESKSGNYPMDNT